MIEMYATSTRVTATGQSFTPAAIYRVEQSSTPPVAILDAKPPKLNRAMRRREKKLARRK